MTEETEKVDMEEEGTLSKEKTNALKDQKPVKKEKVSKKKKTKKPKLSRIIEPRKKLVRAVGGGLLGVLSVVALTYAMWGFITEDSIMTVGVMFDVLSMGNSFNAFLGVWAISFTPLTSLYYLKPNWMDNLLMTLIPIAFAGFTIGITTRRIGTAILGGIFFVFWGIVLPILFVYIFSVFGLSDPALLDAILMSLLEEPLKKWNYDMFLHIFNNNIFISWCAAGTLEMSLLITVIAIPVAGIIQLLGKIFKRK